MRPATPAPRTGHTDAVLLQRASEAMAWWTEQTDRTATSSITGGGTIAELEEALLDLLGSDDHCLALPSGSTALLIALEAVGVQAGDEVLTAAYDWDAALTAIRRIGATPVFLNVDPSSATIEPTAVRAALTARTAACIATDLFGIPADIPALREALRGTPIVEDAAQALGSTLDAVSTGALGADVTVFSFGPGKIVDAGEGGALVTAHRRLHEYAVQATQHPVRQQLTGLCPRPASSSARISPLSALIAAHQLRRLDLGEQQHARWAAVQHVRLAHPGVRVLGDCSRRTNPVLDLIVDPGPGTYSTDHVHRVSLPGATWLDPTRPAPDWVARLRRASPPSSTPPNARKEVNTVAHCTSCGMGRCARCGDSKNDPQ
ncbi:aminotransferase class I/II-fold pyridoxal phosphate-dependent enzyme [Allobranchiibius sp. CTAmp26]|uniref:aminotransferase class I/II-fold pyridoxal phosphate-dependent enzyme n=1 Tax=Allobranchiibius sp. CTAmp26 TaxID=2815214 RepID=UPI001AA111F2|nr:aminotransferase class I/II-fold pyridoxal phosphate-dependent enzyme [Allobranchiibius sp. CTAmp26]MBO1756524.1 DegT/DnrJ/EryC1/StrS family aminotransferase [Allobranchiibius sp. CTAmp26]